MHLFQNHQRPEFRLVITGSTVFRGVGKAAITDGAVRIFIAVMQKDSESGTASAPQSERFQITLAELDGVGISARKQLKIADHFFRCFFLCRHVDPVRELVINFPQTIDAPTSGFSGWTCAEIVAVIVFVVVVRLFLPGIRGGVEIDFKRAVEPVEVRTDIADGLPEFGEKEILSVPDFDPEPEVFPAFYAAGQIGS